MPTSIRAALATRDEVLAALPYYSDWVARRRAVEEAERVHSTTSQGARNLWRDAHYLARLLEVADPHRITEAVPLDIKDAAPPQRLGSGRPRQEVVR